MKIISSLAMGTALLVLASCGNGAATPPRTAASGGEALHSSDLDRAKSLYRSQRNLEGAEILRTLAADRDWSVRSHAIRVIGELRDTTLLPVVHAALADERLEVRESASRVLGTLGDATSRAPLREALRDDAGIVRSHAAAGLLRIGGAGELAAVAQLVEDDPDPSVRAVTVMALSASRLPEAIPLLLRALGDDSAVVRGEAVDAAALTGSPEARRRLETIAASDADAAVRERARLALGRMGP